jgi:hypothetical protein
MVLRAIWYVCLAAVWFATDLSGTFFGWMCVVLLSFASGHWATRVWTICALTVQEQMSEEQQPLVEQELILDPERDYVVNPAAPVWLTVGNYSVQVIQNELGQARINVYHLYREDEDPVARVEV